MSNTTNIEKVVAVLRSIETGDQTAFAYINPEKYIQHNLSLPDGVAGIGSVVGSQPVGTFKAKVVRTFGDGDFVVAHTIYDFFGPKIGFDVFRFENEVIVEHWDNLIDILPNNPSGRTQTDGETTLSDFDLTDKNKALVQSFVEDNWLGKKNNSEKYINSDKYIQHNPGGADGLQSFLGALKGMAESNISMYFTKIHKVLGCGNFVLTMSEGMYGANGGQVTSFYDMFRVENGMIVEHWDVIETIMDKSLWKNTNGKF